MGHPEEFEDPLETAWTSGGDHCGKEVGDEEMGEEAAEREAELAVVKPFALKDSDGLLEPVVEL